MSSKSPRLRALRARLTSITIDKVTPEKTNLEDETENDSLNIAKTNDVNDANKLNEILQYDNNNDNVESTIDESDSDDESRLVIKEEPEENVDEDLQEENSTNNKQDDKQNNKEDDLQDNQKYDCTSCHTEPQFINLVDYFDHVKDKHQEKSSRRSNNKNTIILNKKFSTTVKSLKCKQCKYIAVNSNDMDSHQRLNHLKRRFFRCTKCSYMTHVRARYTKHVKYHSMPMIKCNDCDFKTSYKWNLDRHNRNHAGGGPLQCRACNFTADIRQSLTVHEMNHHEPPVGDMIKSFSLDRMNKNILKRHNQIGGSDYRDHSKSPIDKNQNDEMMNIDDETNEMAGAGCIALSCDEKGCPFITAWDSEMQRHIIEAHGDSHSPNKLKKPLPMLIPLSPGSKSSSAEKLQNSLNVPRVRVRPELAKIARDTEIAKLYRNYESSPQTYEKAVDSFEKRNSMILEKLREHLNPTTSTSGLSQLAVDNSIINELKCWCTYQATCQNDYDNHKKTHHTALSVLTIENDDDDDDDYDDDNFMKCNNCFRSFNNEIDRNMHVENCKLSLDNTNYHEDSSYNNGLELFNQLDWDACHGGVNSSGSSADGVVNHGNTKMRKVFKCPHCDFWAATASRFHVHIVGHLNRKPFECSLCAYKSNWRWDITKHIRIRSGKDSNHINARVLMTDETGRRNYTKYNRYLVQMRYNSGDDPNLEESQGEIPGVEKKRRKLNQMDSSEQPDFRSSRAESQSIKTALSIDINSTQEKFNNDDQNDRLLKINQTNTSNLMDNITASTSTEEAKQSQWRCKICDYRSPSKDSILVHVRTHYGTLIKQTNPPIKINNSCVEYTCNDCPFVAKDESTLSMHKVYHRTNLDAIFKCCLCPFYVNVKSQLLEHLSVHGKNVDNMIIPNDLKTQKSPITKNNTIIDKLNNQLLQPSSMLIASGSNEKDAPPLLLDTRCMPESPLVWVTHNDGEFSKMLKCRHCPFVSSRRIEVRDHEAMHNNNNLVNQQILLSCPDCSFCCHQKNLMESHTNMHRGALGTVHCLVDHNRTDKQQLNDLKILLGLNNSPKIGKEPDLNDSRIILSCNMCPARFLYEKELNIHLRSHQNITSLAYSCEWCSYAARQELHLQSHYRVHSTEYQEKTRYLTQLYGCSQRYPPPMTACIETNKNKLINKNKKMNVAWIVVEVALNNENTNEINSENNPMKVFTCDKCPSKYFKISALNYHKTLHGSDNHFKCTECDYSSKTLQNLLKHQLVHQRYNQTTNNRIIGSSINDINLQTNLMNNNLQSDNIKIIKNNFQCQKCPSLFDEHEEYNQHLLSHGANERFSCDKCDYSVQFYGNYVKHQREHDDYDKLHVQKNNIKISPIIYNNNDSINKNPVVKGCRKSTISSGKIFNSKINDIIINDELISMSNQDKQAALFTKSKIGQTISSIEKKNFFHNNFRCHECPYISTDKDVYDLHRRRHRSETQTLPCPHCNYVPKKDENINDHIKLHFNRLYKPEAYLVVDNLTLTIKCIDESKKNSSDDKLLFCEVDDDTFLPAYDFASIIAASKNSNDQHKIIVDPNTGETTHSLRV